MSSRKEYEAKVKAKFEKLESEIDRLKDQLRNAEAELLPEHHSKLEELAALKKQAGQKIEELIQAGDEKWEHLQHGLEHYFESVGREMDSYENFFKKD